MRLWTVQPLTVWEQIQQHGEVHVDEARMHTPSFVPPAYRWLVRQLEQRLTGYPGTCPWWTYCEKPDLRWVRHTRPAGEQHVRIELEPAFGTFLAFPRWAWDRIYCRQYLSFTRSEHDEWTAAMRRAVPDEDAWPLPEPWGGQLEASWLRLFDRDLPPRSWHQGGGDGSDSQEAVLGTLRLTEVREVKHFVGCSKWRP
jgi:hypothetical protein